MRIDDIIEVANHFRAIDYVIDKAGVPLSEGMIKEIHRILKTGTNDSTKDWFAVGECKKLPNEVGGMKTAQPEEIPQEVKKLLRTNGSKSHNLEEIIGFHVRLERIHPFQNSKGRVGRLIVFKECLANGIVPFVIADDLNAFYYRGLSGWDNERDYLRDVCLVAQECFKETQDYFRIDR